MKVEVFGPRMVTQKTNIEKRLEVRILVICKSFLRVWEDEPYDFLTFHSATGRFLIYTIFTVCIYSFIHLFFTYLFTLNHPLTFRLGDQVVVFGRPFWATPVEAIMWSRWPHVFWSNTAIRSPTSAGRRKLVQMLTSRDQLLMTMVQITTRGKNWTSSKILWKRSVLKVCGSWTKTWPVKMDFSETDNPTGFSRFASQDLPPGKHRKLDHLLQVDFPKPNGQNLSTADDSAVGPPWQRW